jgi:hypothetical protein
MDVDRIVGGHDLGVLKVLDVLFVVSQSPKLFVDSISILEDLFSWFWFNIFKINNELRDWFVEYLRGPWPQVCKA